MDLTQPRLWLPDLQLGLGLWPGTYQDIERQWLCWYDVKNQWILTLTEREQQLVEQEQRRVNRLVEQLRSLGVEPNFGAEHL